jgi:hypothetical protein
LGVMLPSDIFREGVARIGTPQQTLVVHACREANTVVGLWPWHICTCTLFVCCLLNKTDYCVDTTQHALYFPKPNSLSKHQTQSS